MTFLSVIGLLLLTTTFGFTIAREIPKYIELCHRSYPPAQLEACFLKNYNVIIPKLSKSIPDLNLPKLEPIEISDIVANLGAQAGSVNATLHKVLFYGLSKAKIDNVRAKIDPKTGQIQAEIQMSIENAHLDSEYNAKGKFLLFQFDATGHFIGNFTKTYINLTWIGDIVQRNNVDYYQFRSGHFELDFDGMKVHFADVFPNNQELTNTINEAINENMNSLYLEIKPIISKIVEEIVIQITNRVGDAYPADVIVPK